MRCGVGGGCLFVGAIRSELGTRATEEVSNDGDRITQENNFLLWLR